MTDPREIEELQRNCNNGAAPSECVCGSCKAENCEERVEE